MKLNKQLCAAALCCALLAGTLSGCGNNNNVTSSGSTASSGTAAAPTTTTIVKPTNPLTGLQDLEMGASTRPVGVMIANNDFIRTSQLNIDQADMYMEAETEGGITRIMAVFSNGSRVPDLIGPIRSARSPFVHVVKAMDIIYCHAGGSVAALSNIASDGVEDVDALVYESGEEGVGFWRDDDLASEHDYEYTLVSGRDAIDKVVQDRGYSQTIGKAVPWAFGTQTTTGNHKADAVQIKMSSDQTICFEYKDGVYYKNNGTIENNDSHVDAEGVQLSAANVVTLFSTKFWENELTIDFYLQEGYGVVCTGGQSRAIKWSRDDSGIKMTELNGAQVQVAKGKTYLCVVDEEYANEMYSEQTGTEGSRVTWSDVFAASEPTAAAE